MEKNPMMANAMGGFGVFLACLAPLPRHRVRKLPNRTVRTGQVCQLDQTCSQNDLRKPIRNLHEIRLRRRARRLAGGLLENCRSGEVRIGNPNSTPKMKAKSRYQNPVTNGSSHIMSFPIFLPSGSGEHGKHSDGDAPQQLFEGSTIYLSLH